MYLIYLLSINYHPRIVVIIHGGLAEIMIDQTWIRTQILRSEFHAGALHAEWSNASMRTSLSSDCHIPPTLN